MKRATINSLPPELLRLIFLFSVDAVTAPFSSSLSIHVHSQTRARNSLLLSLIRVCRLWATEARPLLHLTIVLWNEDSAQLLLSNPEFGLYRTTTLKIVGVAGKRIVKGSTTARRIVERAKGLRKLELLDFRQWNMLDFDMFTTENLKDLKYLNLSSHFTHDPATHPTLRLPFLLTNLQLDDPVPHSSPPRPTSYSPFSSPSITSLDITVSHNNADFTILFQSLAPQLVWLRFKLKAQDPSYRPYFEQCSNLKVFAIEFDHEGFNPFEEAKLFLERIPSKLKFLTVRVMPDEVEELLKLNCLEGLEELGIDNSLWFDENHDLSDRVKQVLEKRRIEVKFALKF